MTGIPHDQVHPDTLAAIAAELPDVLAAIADEEKTYKIVRFFQDSNKEKEVIETGLTLEEAQEHCSLESTHGDGWFDGYDEE